MVREEETVGRAVIRTVRVAGARLHYENVDGKLSWRRMRKPDAPVTYRVEIDGKPVNSFLRKSAARACAKRLAMEP